MAVLDPIEIPQLQAYLQKTFANNGFALKIREKATDSVEVILNGEFIGLIYKDDEEGEVSYNFDMAILDIDLASANS
ncbi:DUF3126 family protein [Alphaproteobacteria bacterium]|nr:DUF3126 family protein [Alphaproteobacteria bacterium]